MALWPFGAREAVAPYAHASQTPDSLHEHFGRAVTFETSGEPVPVAGIHEATVSRELTLSVPAILRAVTILTTTFAKLPLKRFDSSGRRVELGWLAQPEAGRPRYNTFIDTARDLILDGRAYWHVKTRTGTGEPAFGGVEYVKLNRVTTFTAADDTVTISIDGRPVPASNVIGFTGWHDGIRKHGARTIRTALALEAAAKRYADTSGALINLEDESGYALSDDEILVLVRAYKAMRNREGVSYTSKGMKATQVGLNAKEMQLVEARMFVSSLCADLVGVPEDVIATASTTSTGAIRYANVTQEARTLIDYGLDPLLNAVESRLSLSDAIGSSWDKQVTPRGSRVEVDLDGLLRGDAKQRAEVYQLLIPLGVMSVEQAQAIEGFAPIGDTA